MKNNIDTMDDSLRIIGEKKALLIYPEGSTHQTIYLRPLKKGTARLALQAKKMHQDLPLKLIPIAVNYTDPNAFRSDVMIEIGKPVNIQLKDEKEIPANQQIMQLTSQLETQMKALVKQVDPIEEEDLVIELLQLKAGFDPYKPFPVFERSNVHLQTDRELVYQFNAMEDKASLKEKWQLLRSLLHTKGLHDLVRYKSASHFILKAILLIVLFPFFLVATIVHFIPIFTMKRIIRKYVKSREFETSVLTAGSAGLVVLLYFSFTILALIFKPIWILLIPIFLISLFAAAFFYDILLDLRLQLKLFISGKRYRKQLFDEARAILHSLNFNN
jgi:hypothetical protein